MYELSDRERDILEHMRWPVFVHILATIKSPATRNAWSLITGTGLQEAGSVINLLQSYYIAASNLGGGNGRKIGHLKHLITILSSCLHQLPDLV